jgi:hypothetical protein
MLTENLVTALPAGITLTERPENPGGRCCTRSLKQVLMIAPHRVKVQLSVCFNERPQSEERKKHIGSQATLVAPQKGTTAPSFGKAAFNEKIQSGNNPKATGAC